MGGSHGRGLAPGRVETAESGCKSTRLTVIAIEGKAEACGTAEWRVEMTCGRRWRGWPLLKLPQLPLAAARCTQLEASHISLSSALIRL